MRSRSMLLFVLLAMGGSVGAQTLAEPDPRPVQAVEETIHVQAVNLEAVVTDARGRRVPGLTADDFRLKVDGIDTPITFFHPIEEGRGQIESSTQSAEPAWQSRSILVFLDESTMVKARRNIILRNLVKQLDGLASGDQMAVVAFSGSGLEVLCNWTSDQDRLESVLTGVKKRPAHGIHMEVARWQEMSDAGFADLMTALNVYHRNPGGNPFADDNIFTRPGPTSTLELEDQASSIARWQKPSRPHPTVLFYPLTRYLEVAEAAGAAMRGLPAPPGRKMLLLLTEAFQELAFARPVVDEAGRLGYSLYPVDVKGIDTFLAQNDAMFGSPMPFMSVSSDVNRDIDYALGVIAAATGGKASLNSNRLVALERLVEDSAAYYLLGFSPTWRGDDRRHRIDLTVTRPGLKVRTRDGYVDASRRTRLTLQAEATLMLGQSQSEPRLIVTVEHPAAGAERSVPVSVGVPVESLAFMPREGGFRAETPVAMAVLDKKGKRKWLEDKWLVVEVTELPVEGSYARANFSLAPGHKGKRIVVTVHDALSGEALWGEARLDQ
jgi:VWFA-related protein